MELLPDFIMKRLETPYIFFCENNVKILPLYLIKMSANIFENHISDTIYFYMYYVYVHVFQWIIFILFVSLQNLSFYATEKSVVCIYTMGKKKFKNYVTILYSSLKMCANSKRIQLAGRREYMLTCLMHSCSTSSFFFLFLLFNECLTRAPLVVK